MDWNNCVWERLIKINCRSLRGNVDWNFHFFTAFIYLCVVPYAGTWIETGISRALDQLKHVVPYAGTWIETWSAPPVGMQCLSFPTRERGLKLSSLSIAGSLRMSFPTRERGLKLCNGIPGIRILCVVPYAGTWIKIVYSLLFGYRRYAISLLKMQIVASQCWNI